MSSSNQPKGGPDQGQHTAPLQNSSSTPQSSLPHRPKRAREGDDRPARSDRTNTRAQRSTTQPNVNDSHSHNRSSNQSHAAPPQRHAPTHDHGRWNDGGRGYHHQQHQHQHQHQQQPLASSHNTRFSSPPQSSPSPQSKLYHPFRANFNDHFETSLDALRDVLPVLQELRQLTRPSTPELYTVYDPYYCAGSIVQRWNTLGITHVLHENRDFYADIARGTVPGPYDILVTNPPFSDDHLQRLMHFLLRQSKPWAVLAPDYIAGKEWYRDLVRRHFTPAPPTGKGDINAPRGKRPTLPASALLPPPFLLASQPTATESESALSASTASPSLGDGVTESTASTAEGKHVKTENAMGATSGDKSTQPPAATASSAKPPIGIVGPEPMYIVPRVTYDFEHPTGAGHAHSHFKSMWYVWAGRRTPEVLRATKVALLSSSSSSSSVETGRTGGGGHGSAPPRAPPAVVHGLEALAEGHYVAATAPRPNPQRRAATVGHGGRY